jgi:hypothetical protein
MLTGILVPFEADSQFSPRRAAAGGMTYQILGTWFAISHLQNYVYSLLLKAARPMKQHCKVGLPPENRDPDARKKRR